MIGIHRRRFAPHFNVGCTGVWVEVDIDGFPIYLEFEEIYGNIIRNGDRFEVEDVEADGELYWLNSSFENISIDSRTGEINIYDVDGDNHCLTFGAEGVRLQTNAGLFVINARGEMVAV